jgi:hypothetical protein
LLKVEQEDRHDDTPVILVFRRLRQQDQELQASLVYTITLCIVL